MAQTVINEVIPNTPAAEAGLQAGDIIVGADGVDFKHIGDLVSYIEKTKGTEVTLHIERKGEIIQASLVPRANPPENQGAMGVGISYEGIENTLTYQPLPASFGQRRLSNCSLCGD